MKHVKANAAELCAVLFFVAVSSEAALTAPESQKFLPSDGVVGNSFGKSVSVSGDVAVIGAHTDRDWGWGSGAAYVYERQANGSWTERQKLSALDGEANDYFGESVSVSGGVAVIGASGDDDMGSSAGSAYVFE